MSKRFEDKIIYKEINLKNKNNKHPALFLDRDGVIIEDTHYINDPNKVKLCVGAKKFIRNIFERNILIVVVTNQSGISKNIISWEQYYDVTQAMIEKLGNPNPIAAIYANSFNRNCQKNNWRKPNPNMILEASKDLNLDINNSLLIGDRKTDLFAGLRAGAKKLIHVETGHGKKERFLIQNYLNKENKIVEGSKSSKVFFMNNLENFPYDLI